MRFAGVVTLALGLFASSSALAQTAPPFALPPLPAPPTVFAPPPNLAPWLQSAASAAAQATSCPPVEVAPNVFVPVCAEVFAKPPPGLPEIVLPPSSTAPPAMDLRALGLDGPIKDQKQTGVCWAFALTTALESSLRAQRRGEVLSPLHVVAAGTYGDAIGGRMREPITLEASWPYDPVKACKLKPGHDSCERTYGVQAGTWRSDPALAAEREGARARGVVPLGAMRSLRADRGDWGPSLVSAIASRRAVYAVIAIDSRAWSFRGIQSGVLSEYDQADRGEHAVVVVAYRTTTAGRQFLLHNSWSATWGEGGYAWISEVGLRKHMTYAYVVEAGAPGLASTLPSAPPAAPAATCASGMALDLGTGRCAAACRSGAAPILGRCWLG